MRSGVLFLPLVAVGCGTAGAPPRTSRVELPQGLERPKGLKPDPKPVAAPAKASATDPAPDGDATIPASAVRSAQAGPFVAGACRYGEDAVECWNVAGERDKRLTGSVKAILRTRREPLPTTFGKRNRIVVVDLPRSAEDVTYQVVAAAPPYGGTTTVVGSNGRELAFVAEDDHAPQTSVRFVRSQRLAQTALLPLKKGATAKLAGCLLTVDSAAKLEPRDEMAFLFRGGPGWKVVVRRTGGGPHPPTFTIEDPYPMLMMDGRRARFVGKAGKPEYAPKDAPRIQVFGSSELPKDAFAALVDLDPAKAKPFVVSARQERTITLTGIPLDPR